MKPRERTVIYSLLATLMIVQMCMLLSTNTGAAAWAHARALFDDLGPAAAIRLADPDDSAAPELVLRNKAGKLAFGDSAHTTVFSIGFMHVGKALGKLMDSESMSDERDRMDQELNDKDEELRSRMQAFEEQHRDVKPDSPNFEEVRQAYTKLIEEIRAWQMEKSQRRETLLSGQIEKAYRDVIAAVEVVAEKQKIDIVYRFVPTDGEFDASSPGAAYESIRSRIALKYPDGLDLTDLVLEELDLEVD